MKSEHFERKVSGLQESNDSLEAKLEESTAQLKAAQHELAELHRQLEDL